ncbi:MAG TPA: TIGR03086 family metal-binding protein [Trebonia sp.]|nr:TIGR03086 family metal-binding protein [Trebonia sp.]
MTDAADAAARTVDQVDAAQLGLPTPDTDWDVRTLVNHLILWTSYSLEARAHGGSVSEDLMDRDFAAEPGFAAAYRAQLDRALAAWSEPAVWEGSLDVMGSATPAADVAALNLAEMVLHGWDLAVATGQRYQVSDRAAAVALDAVAANAELFRQYKGFADPVEVPAGAQALDRVLALSGRDPGWAPERTG